MPKKTAPAKAKVWSHKGEANKKVRALFHSGKWDPENYAPKDLWLSDKLFQEYPLPRFRDNIRKTARAVILEGGKYSDSSGSESEGVYVYDIFNSHYIINLIFNLFRFTE